MVTPFLNCLNYSNRPPPPAKALPPHLRAARLQDRVCVNTTKGDDICKRAAVRNPDRTRRRRARRTKRLRNRVTRVVARKSKANPVGAATRKREPNRTGKAVRKSGASQFGEATQKSKASRVGAADPKSRAAPGGPATLIRAANTNDAPKRRRIETELRITRQGFGHQLVMV